MSRQDVVQDKIEVIKNCNHAITIISKLMIEFQIDSDCNKEIPEWMKGVYITSGFLNAIKIAAQASEEAVEWLETELDDGRQSDS
jgi:hypothetical protein